MTDAEIDEIEARCNAATAGPWQVWNGLAYCGGGKDLCIGAGENWVVNMDHRWGPGYQERVDHEHDDGRSEKYDCPICQFSEEVTDEQAKTADFIAHARTDIPRLIEALRIVMKERDRLKQENDEIATAVQSFHEMRFEHLDDLIETIREA